MGILSDRGKLVIIIYIAYHKICLAALYACHQIGDRFFDLYIYVFIHLTNPNFYLSAMPLDFGSESAANPASRRHIVGNRAFSAVSRLSLKIASIVMM